MHSIRRQWRVCAALVLAMCALALQPAQAAAPLTIYENGLGSGWQSWSFNAAVMLDSTEQARSGNSLKVTLNGYGGLFIHNGGVATADYTTLRFFIHGGSAGGQALTLCANTGDCNGRPSYQVAATANAWKQFDVPLSALGSPATISELLWKNDVGTMLPGLYFDDIALVSIADANAPALSLGSVLPGALPADGATQALVKVKLADPQGANDIASVTLDASAFGRGTLALHDDGRSGDGAANDGVYGTPLTVALGTATGAEPLVVTALDKGGHSATFNFGTLVVLAQPGGSIPAGLPQRLGWGTNEWFDQGKNWQNDSGVPWDYSYRYITYEWYTDGSRWGNYVQQVTKNAWEHSDVPVITVYNMLGATGGVESSKQYAETLQDATIVRNYLAALTQAATDAKGDKPVIFQLEPDFYGFMQQLSNDAANRPAGVKPDDPASYPVALNVAGYPNTLAGFGKRMVDVVHQTASNALVGVHASAWATNGDQNNGTAADTIAIAKRTASFMNAMGGAEADLLFVEWSDRDAGSGLRPYWDDTNRALPSFARAVLWENALSAAAGKRLLLWQVPAGNMSQNDTCNHYRDNRAAYAFNHPRDLIGAGVIGVMFGAGAACMTTAASDGGFIGAQGAIAYAAPAAPVGLHATGMAGATASLAWSENSEPDIAGYRVRAAGPNGLTIQLDTGVWNQASLLLPQAGSYQVSIAARDATGQVSNFSDVIDINSTANAQQMFVPLVGR